MISGTTYPKLTQNGHYLDQKARIRPTGILSVESWPAILPVSSRGRNQAIPMGSLPESQNARVGIRRLEPLGKVEEFCAMIRAQDNYPSRSDLQPLRSVSMQWRAKKLPEPGRSAQEMSVEETAFCTNLQRASGASNRRWWTGGVSPRPAGLREAARPNPVMPHV